MMGWLGKIFGADKAISDVVSKVGDGAGSLMDRFGFTKKMGEAEKIDKYIEVVKATSESDKIDASDLKSAREMAIIQMQTQKASWFVRQLNGSLRPVAGWFSLIAMTNKVWGQALSQLIPDFVWNPITFDVAESAALTGILAFFFGFRQRSKEKKVNLSS